MSSEIFGVDIHFWLTLIEELSSVKKETKTSFPSSG